MKRLIVHFAVALCVSTALVSAQQSSSSVAEAARRGDATAVKTLLQQGADVNAALGDGMTALHWAADRGDAALAEMLLYAGANPAAVTRIGNYTPLHLAAKAGSAGVVKALLAKGADPSVRVTTGGVAPLHLAAAAGSVEAVTLLLDKGADVNMKETEWNQTPLIFAASFDRVDVVNLLIKRGADVEALTRTVNLTQQQQVDRQATALYRTVLANTVAKGEEPTASQQQAAFESMRELFVSGKVPEPPAPGAAGAGRGGAGGGGGRGGAPAADPDPAAAQPQPGAGRQFGGGAPGGQPTQTDLQNAEGGPAPNTNAKGGMNALHHAARQGYTRTAAALLDAGAKIDKKTGDGHTPLLVALINGQFDTAMELIKRGADVNAASDAHGATPLWAAVNTRWQPRTRFPQPQEMELQKATYLDVMQALLDKGADPNARLRAHPWYMVYTGCGNGNCGLPNMSGATAFWRAAYSVDLEAMKLLVKAGADPNIPTFIQRAAGGGRGGFAGGGGGGGGRGGGGGGRGGGGGGNGDDPVPAAPATPAPAGAPALPPVPPGGPAVYAIHAAAGVEYGEGFVGNAHRHAPDGWLPTVKYLVEVLGADVNARDDGGYTPLHHAAARGDNEMILYLISKGADVKAVSRRGQTTVDMANGPVSRISPFPDTIALLEKLGAINNHKCQSC